MSPMVIDSTPALDLDSWTVEEIGFARSSEGGAFGIDVPHDPTTASDNALAAIPLQAAPKDPRLLEAAIHHYSLAAVLAADMGSEFRRHLSNPLYAMRIQLYASHLDDSAEYQAMTAPIATIFCFDPPVVLRRVSFSPPPSPGTSKP